MIFTLSQLIDDLLAWMGEAAPAASPAGISGAMDVPTALRRKASVLLPAVGSLLILEAPAAMLPGAEHYAGNVELRRAGCGLYAADLSLPEDMVRIVSVKMAGWNRTLERFEEADSAAYGCQWSQHPAIAGNPDRPKGYLRHGNGGRILTVIGSVGAGDAPEHLLLWRVPKVDVGGSFRFPAPLYPELVEKLSAEL